MRKTQLKYKMTTLGSHDKDILSPLGELDLILLFQLSSSKTGVTLITKKNHKQPKITFYHLKYL